MDVSIIIVNWNVCDLLARCLDTLYRDQHPFTYEVNVVDNASTDGSVDMLKKRYPAVQVIQNQTNAGFAQGNIQAFEQCRGRYVLLLNPDTELCPGALAKLYHFLESNTNVAAVGPDLRNPDGTRQMGCYPFPTLLRETWRLLHLDRLYAYGIYPVHRWSEDLPRQVDVIQGACLLLRRAALDQVGFLDSDYFMYTEEVDLCYRLKRAGWQIWWLPLAQIIHYGGQSTHQATEAMFIRLYESKTLFFRKSYGHFAAQVYKSILFLAAILRIGLGPLVWLLKPERRSEIKSITSNYRRLLEAIPGY